MAVTLIPDEFERLGQPLHVLVNEPARERPQVGLAIRLGTLVQPVYEHTREQRVSRRGSRCGVQRRSEERHDSRVVLQDEGTDLDARRAERFRWAGEDVDARGIYALQATGLGDRQAENRLEERRIGDAGGREDLVRKGLVHEEVKVELRGGQCVTTRGCNAEM